MQPIQLQQQSSSSGDGSNFSKTWELNLYEQSRVPQEIIYDDRSIAVSPKVLQNELMCPICLDILKKTMTTKECLHRFCHDCIITALRAGNKECPTCRKKLVSKRSLRHDPNFDNIIAKIYPNREEYDAMHEKVLEKLNKKHLAQPRVGDGTTAVGEKSHKSNKGAAKVFGQSTNGTSEASVVTATATTATPSTSNGGNKGVKRTSGNINNTTTVSAISANSEDSDMESRASTEQSSTHYAFQTDSDEIELVLKPHPTKETSLTSKRFLKTTSNATMTHLSKYLWTRLCVEAGTSNTETTAETSSVSDPASEQSEFQLYIPNNSGYQQLNSNLTLEQVIDQYWKQNRPIEIFYSAAARDNRENDQF